MALMVETTSVEYLNQQIVEFRQMWSDRRISLSILDKMFECLGRLALRLGERELPQWDAACREWTMRRFLMEAKQGAW